MPIKYNIGNILEDLDNFQMSIEAVDMESVKERTLKRAAQEMASMVRQAVFESSINSPADKISPYEGGDGPPLVTYTKGGGNDAWLVEKSGGKYVVKPHPEVRQRAIVLNYGYPGDITPNDSQFLKFEVEGTPIFKESVPGPDATGYWQVAFRRMQGSDKLEEIAGEELEKEFEESF